MIGARKFNRSPGPQSRYGNLIFTGGHRQLLQRHLRTRCWLFGCLACASNDTEESPDIEGSETDRLVRVILPNQQRTDEKAADPEECIDTQIPVFRNGANNGGMGEKYKPPVEADHSNDRQSTPAVQSGYVGGKARAFCHLLLSVPCPGTHTIHPDGERTVVAWHFTAHKIGDVGNVLPSKDPSNPGLHS
jgi:hypothetical protein